MSTLPNPFQFACPSPRSADPVAASSPSAVDHISNSCGGGESRPAPIGPQASAPRRSKELIGEAGVAPSPQESRFVLNEIAFAEAIEEPPLFLRPGFAADLMPVLAVLAGH